jgi:hypothetical protein
MYNKPLIYAVVGSRSFKDYRYLEAILDKIFSTKNVLKIISGGAIGADTLAMRYANEHKINFVEYKADWVKYDKSAGLVRNMQMANICDVVIAFWDGKSTGTAHMIDICKSQNKKVIIKKIDKRKKRTW